MLGSADKTITVNSPDCKYFWKCNDNLVLEWIIDANSLKFQISKIEKWYEFSPGTIGAYLGIFPEWNMKACKTLWTAPIEIRDWIPVGPDLSELKGSHKSDSRKISL